MFLHVFALSSVIHNNQSLLYLSYPWNFRHLLVRYYWYIALLWTPCLGRPWSCPRSSLWSVQDRCVTAWVAILWRMNARVALELLHRSHSCLLRGSCEHVKSYALAIQSRQGLQSSSRLLVRSFTNGMYTGKCRIRRNWNSPAWAGVLAWPSILGSVKRARYSFGVTLLLMLLGEARV